MEKAASGKRGELMNPLIETALVLAPWLFAIWLVNKRGA